MSTHPRDLVRLEVELIPQIRSRWEKVLADRTTNRSLAESAISNCYDYAGLVQPRILWTENPLTAIGLLINRPDLKDVASQVLSRVWGSCNQEIERQIKPGFIRLAMANANPRAQIAIERRGISFDPLGDLLNQVSISKIQQVYPQLDSSSLPAALQDYRIAYLSYFDYFQQIGLDIPQVQLLVDLAKSCGCCWTFTNIAILTPKPTAIEFDDRGGLQEIVYDGVNILAPT